MTGTGKTEPVDAPMTPAEQAAYVPQKPVTPAERPVSQQPSPEKVVSPSPKAVKALYAKDMLSDPRVRGMHSKLPSEKRIVQMCGMEANEQVRYGARMIPDLLKSFGKGGGLITGTHLTARGGAVRSLGTWYEITFDCTVNAAFDTITAFRFALGSPVPRAQWASRGLMLD